MMRLMQVTSRTRRLVILTIALAAAVPTAYGQETKKPSAAAMEAAKELITVTGVTESFNPLIAGVIEQAKLPHLQQDPALSKDLNEIATQMRTELQPRFVEIKEEMSRLYATHFTEQELKEILVFYKSSTGKKLLEEQSKVFEGSLKFAQDWANKLSDEVAAKMDNELKKRGRTP